MLLKIGNTCRDIADLGALHRETSYGPQVLSGLWMYGIRLCQSRWAEGLSPSEPWFLKDQEGVSWGPLCPPNMTQMLPEQEKLQPAGFPLGLSCLFMLDFIGCHSFYINWLYGFHGFFFLSLPTLSEKAYRSYGKQGQPSLLLLRLGHRMTASS